uniref:Sulfotransferase n=1 Tax=Tetradesmus obliquus TaxID=3088 RepID=A0A383VA60_TETOB|eukprot:jgi/Sobl393_1/9301/SZX61494.1
MELIGAGCGRTGTLSLKMALEILGMPCYHMVTIIRRGDVGFWHDAAEGKAVDFTSVLKGSAAVCDWPANFFYKQLMETFPEAKVILTVRDPTSWYDSVKETVWAICKAMNDAPAYVRWLDGFFPPGRKMGPMMDKVLWQGILQGDFEDREAAQQRYLEWNDAVKQLPFGQWAAASFPPGCKMGPMMEKVLWQGILKGDFEDRESAQQRYLEWNEGVKQPAGSGSFPSRPQDAYCAHMGPMMDKVLWQGILKGDFEDREAAQQHYLEWNEAVKQMGPMMDKVLWQGILKGDFEDPAAAQQRYLEWNEAVKQMGPMMEAVLWQGILKGDFEDPAAAQQRYLEWNEGVSQHVPADRLLVFHPSQGWEPLCSFLGKPVPQQPFPHVNDTQGFKDMVKYVHIRHQAIQVVVPALAVAAVGGLALLLSRRSRQ